MPLTLRSIGIRDYRVSDDGQRIGRIRYASERTPGIWIWDVQVHIPCHLPKGTARSLDDAKADFRAAWIRFKSEHTPEEFAKAYAAMNIRDDG
jgi:hypothetical protein